MPATIGRDAFTYQAGAEANRSLGALCENLGHIHFIAIMTCRELLFGSWLPTREELSRSSRLGSYRSRKCREIRCYTDYGSFP